MKEEEFEEMLDKYTDIVEHDLENAMERFSGYFDFDPADTTLISGKHLRGVITHLVANAIDPRKVNDITNKMAVTVEMFHQFSLLHDDVMDVDSTRRGKPSFWEIVGIGKAILIGDAGFAHIMSLSASLSGMKAVQALANTLMAVARGVVYEFSDIMSDRTSTQIESKLIEIMELKTSALFALAAQYGAISVNAGPHYEKSAMMYGKKVGTLLQFLDDYVDILKAAIKDEEGGDIKFHRITLPMFLFAQESGETGMKAALEFSLKEISFSDLKSHIDFEKGNEVVLKKIKSLKDDAISEAKAFPESPYRDALIMIPDYIEGAMLDEL